ncbi:AAA family ATPase [Serinicoccus chungangensis]|uniref:AAA family ATPase n=1 Tax=Serinicoccus chungangensis TaxID=767452 RepID=UPI001118D8E3|nr:ATP-binding protein [Serinicoccus chungangensis]
MGDAVRRLRVAEVELEGFRGMPGRQRVAFGDAARPTSALIFGENGSGKSSIVDAVEWACQGRVARQAPSTSPGAPSVVNVAAASATARVRVLLTDGRVVERRAALDAEGTHRIQGDPTPAAFRRVPMSLKRADILKFLGTSPLERAKVFMGHSLDDDPTGSQVATDEAEAVRNDLHSAKASMRAAAAGLAERFGAEPPKSATAIDALLDEHVYKGVPPEHRARVAIHRSVQPDVAEIERWREEVARHNERLRATTQTVPAVIARLRAMHDILGDVSDWLTHAFHAVTGARHVTRLDAVYGAASDMSIELFAHMSNGARRSPQQVFSEGYQDLIALLYFLAVLRAAGERGQAKVLVLDDVLQSVDAGIRVAVMDLVVKEFEDWQLLVTVHDRLWRTQLRDVFQRAGHPVADIEVRGWDFERGPTVNAAADSNPAAALWSALEGQDPHTVCGVAGRVLEQACDRMSWTIPISVKRKHGDAYTLADLWPGTAKELKATSVGGSVAEVDRWLHLRNAAGAHYNEWAEGVTWAEAERFGWAVAELVAALHCSSCGRWVERRGQRTFSCRCSDTEVTPAVK